MPNPKISLITTSLNQGRFLQKMLDSVRSQSFHDYEHIIVDGGSTDNTLELIKKYAADDTRVRWLSEKDENSQAAYLKAMSMVKGKYVIICCTSDGFLDSGWFERCAFVLDNDPEVSLVYGLPQYMTEDGRLGKITTPELLDELPPQKRDFLAFWFVTGNVMYEGNACIRTDIVRRCLPQDQAHSIFDKNVWLDFVYNFNVLGYLPLFVPTVANFGRIHSDAIGQNNTEWGSLLSKKYREKIRRYKEQVLSGKTKHAFRNGASEVIGEISDSERQLYKKKILKIKSKIFMNYTIYQTIRFALRKAHLGGVRDWLSRWS